MNTVIFDTPGILDPRAIGTFGLSAKVTSNPIGEFGTGLKYAISVLLREKQKISIETDGKMLNFTTKPGEFRGQEFQAVLLNGKELPFTLRLGKGWKLWQAFRELESNTRDEDGETYTDAEPGPRPTGQRTRIIVQGDEFFAIWLRRSDIFLSRPVLSKSHFANIHSGDSHHIFYRGVRVYDLKDPSLYSYNLTYPVTLTEDRTLAYLDHTRDIIKMSIARCEKNELLEKILAPGEGTFEFTIDWSNYVADQCSKEFLDAVKTADFQNFSGTNPTIHRFLLNNAKFFATTSSAIVPTEAQRAQVLSAIEFLASIGYDINHEVVLVDTLGPNTLACAKEDKIFLTLEVFQMGFPTLIHALLEEQIHLQYGYLDLTRELQSWLFRELIQQAAKRVGRTL